jgi:ATP-dependent helicase/nuclease subunit A
MSSNNISDMQQRQQALNCQKSFIVQAPAGSGKTELLTQRYLKLLSQTEKAPEEIIAITFTKKAAAEMRARIVIALERAKAPCNLEQEPEKTTQQLALAVLKRDTQLHWGLIDNPNRLRIQTIDALCMQIARQLPIVSQFGASPQITEDASEYYLQATEELLKHLEDPTLPWSHAIAQLLTYLDNNTLRLQTLLTDMLKTRDQWLPYLTPMQSALNAPEKIQTLLCESLKNIVEENLKILRESSLVKYQQTLFPYLQFAQQQLMILAPQHPLAQCNMLLTLPTLEQDNIATWLAISQVFFTKDLKWRKKLTQAEGFPPKTQAPDKKTQQEYVCMKKDMQELLNFLSEDSDLTMALIEFIQSPPTVYRHEHWKALLALIEILPTLAAQLTVVFRDHGIVDFIQVTQAALTALGDENIPSDTALNLDYQIYHILFDEFQDTSLTQFQLLKKLTAGWQQNDGRTLFLVGDPMQSIYRFRQAEVGLFLQAQTHGIHHIPLGALTLTQNFRSCQKIVDWTNHVFSHIFPKTNQINKGGIRYSPAIAKKPDQAQAQIMFHPIFPEHTDQTTTIMTLLKKLKNDDQQQSIAILVRSRSHLIDMTAALQAHQLNYQAIEIERLTQRSLIQDLFALTRALDHLGDRIAWLALLRAPWCGLTLHDLHEIANTHDNITLWEQLQRAIALPSLSQDGMRRLNHIVPVLQQAFSQRTEKSFAQWVETTWNMIGGTALLHNANDCDDATVYFKCLQQVTQAAKPFDIEKMEQKLSRLYASTLPTHENPIQVMTIHKSKGLEFDVVIIPALEKSTPPDSFDLLACEQRLQADGRINIIMAPIHADRSVQEPIYQYLRRTEQQKQDFETQRLLYVAITRTKQQLHLLAHVEIDDTGNTIKPPSGKSFLSQLWPFLKKPECIPELLPPAKSTHTQTLTSWMLKRCSITWLEHFHLTHPLKPNASKPNKNMTLCLPDHNTPLAIGTVVHRYLKQIAEETCKQWSLHRLQQQAQSIQAALGMLSVKPADIIPAQNTVIQAIVNTLNDPTGQWILQPHLDNQAEYAIEYREAGRCLAFVLDRTFVDEAGNRWIIDYKTSVASPQQSLEAFMQEQQQIYAAQLTRYAKAMSHFDHHPIKLGLYFPLMQAWKPWSFHEETLTCL